MSMFSIRRSGLFASTLALVLGMLVVGCKKQGGAKGAGGPGGPGQMPPAEVSVIVAQVEPVTIVNELPGRISAVREAQVRARATGILLKRNFEEGANVKEGDVLFEIDPLPLEAALNSARATLAQAEAALRESKATMQRYNELVEVNAISRQVFDAAVASLAQNEAQVLAGRAAVQTAELNLGYAKVTAPISGRIGKAMVTEGALVSAVEATQLAVIRQLSPIYLDINQSSTEMLKLRRAFESGEITQGGTNQANIKLILDDGTVYPHEGKLLFSDISVDPTTGMVVMRAVFPNPNSILLPGMFARGQLTQGVITNSVVIPQRTLMRASAGSASVMVVNAENTVEVRPVQIAREVGNRAVLAGGLRPGEKVMVEGLQKAPPGSKVTTIPFVEDTGTNTASAATGPAPSRPGASTNQGAAKRG